jgi:dTDP-4-dehydrorhamnose reductase
MQRILLIGKNGQLGWEAHRALAPLGEVIALDYPEIDLTHPETLAGLVADVRPQIIFNAAAYTAVDCAESEPELPRLINAVTPGELAAAARKARAVLVHFSTDYVYDGAKNAPYVEEDAPHPLSVYGQTKLDGDNAVAAAGGAWVVLRPTWVYSTRRESFVSKLLEWSRKNTVLRVVDDQISGPTWARSLAETAALLLARAGSDPYTWLEERAGVYHLSGRGWCSRMEWAQEILRLDPNPELRTAREVVAAKTVDFPTPAQRPLFSALDTAKFEKTFGLNLPEWKTALQLAMAQV